MELAHAVSDSALVLCTLTTIRTLVRGAPRGAQRPHLYGAAFGLGTMALAAFVGVLRFSGLEAMAPLHGPLSAFATAMAMPLVGLAAIAIVRPLPLTRRGWIRGSALLAALFLLSNVVGVQALYGLAIGALGTASALIVGLRSAGQGERGGLLLAVGAVLVLVAGLGVGSTGELGPFDRLDIFHYMLASANLAFGPALVHLARRSAQA